MTTEREMLDALHRRYSARSQANTIRYAVAEFVRNAAGFDATRTADFIAMDLWPRYGKGLELHGHEVKVSRSDWLTELKDPTKAEAFKPWMDRWWLVAAEDGIAKTTELPEGWGLLVLIGGRLRVARQAPRLDCQPMPKTMMAAFLRSVAATADRLAREEVAKFADTLSRQVEAMEATG